MHLNQQQLTSPPSSVILMVSNDLLEADVKICLEIDCEKRAEKRGYCDTHYKRLKNQGVFGGQSCSVEGCTKIASGRGLCPNHYMKWHKFGTTGGAAALGYGKKKKHPLYATWNKIRSRCLSEKDAAYMYYGGRGIKMCDRWRADFWAFVEDIGDRPSKEHTLDRIDPDGDYEPSNCRWADKTVQARNRRYVQLTPEIICEARNLKDKFNARTVDIARMFRVTPHSLYDALSGNSWKNV